MDLATTKAKKKPKKETAVLNVDGVDLPVTFNTNGRLDKKSQDAFNAILNRNAAQNVASRFSAKDAVEVAGFGGLVGMIYYGSDILLQLLNFLKIAETLTDIGEAIIRTPGDIAAALGPELLVFVTAPIQQLMFGMPKKDVENAVESAKTRTQLELVAFTARFQNLKKDINLRLSDAPTIEAEAEARKAIEKLEAEQKKREAERKQREAREVERLLFKIKLATSFGGAYVIKKFLESYGVSEAVENVPFIE